MALSMKPVKVVEVCQIAPSRESATELTLPLTYFDLIWLKFHPGERIYFYQLNESTPNFYRVILPGLKHSLSLTLLHFLPLAGRLTWPSHAPKPTILYSPDDTVSLTVAESKADFNCLSSNQILETAELSPYVPELAVSDSTSPAMAIQITLFPNSGYTVGYSMNHVILDGKSTTMFMKSWALICKQNQSHLPKALTPIFDRTVIEDPEGIDMAYLNHWIKMTNELNPEADPRSLKPILGKLFTESKLVRATFLVTREDIKKLRNRVFSGIDEPNSVRLSSFVLTYAYTIVCMVRSRVDESVNKVRIYLTSDWRVRLGAIPANYFGNCVYSYNAVVEANDVKSENGLIFLVKKLSELIKKVDNGNLEGAKELFEKLEAVDPGTFDISVAGSPLFELYKVDFGWGRPKKVEFISIDDRIGGMSVERSIDGGIEVGMVLEKHEMEVFDSLFVNGLKDLWFVNGSKDPL
ncbi:phenolic glucoside malonyltransferase 1-like [Tripterygium wilfordii]|uniref:Phenolic glucoside malonyltransferase 1-like n=1 Tax=Tripterygium wilfordii TaxID=458696 RepID=A0A7J7CNE2_TRIWF|nr:phenolic glucoside malonyltransferase 1-like [Tripterygium wilfordii]KAF5735603.1 phenolic glucoside malonyltransferase 1-like [Tripterygium wilfordii]